MSSYLRFFLILMITWGAPFQISALNDSSPHVKVELIQEDETIQPGHPFWVALHFELENDWHVYWKNPGDAGIPITVDWLLPTGFVVSPLQWPYPEKFTSAEMIGFGYANQLTLLAQVTPPAHLDFQSKIDLQARIHWLACSSFNCQPGSTLVSIPLKGDLQPPKKELSSSALFKQGRRNIPRTDINIKTMRKRELLQLDLPQEITTSSGAEIKKLEFFPTQEETIDLSMEPILTEIKTETDQITQMINLKETGKEKKYLSGVLVIHKQTGSGEDIQAFEVNSLIESDKTDEIVSMVTPEHLSSSLVNGTAESIEKSVTPSNESFTFEGGFALALAFAFLGGMILNLMPCVLPVMSLKVMSFVKMAGQSRSLTLKHGLMFSFGVILSFWLLASVMLMLRTYGQAVGWGFQLQEPMFVVVLASLLFIFSLNLLGVFEWGMFFASWAGQTQAETAQKKSGEGYTSSFLSGVLATAVATPCTGPFLGSAVGFAVTLSIFPSLLIFTFLALGMCFPYLLLSAFPSFLRFIPKPGPWMETFKQLTAFLLLATVLWLLWVFSAQTDSFSLICLLAGFLFFSIGAWIYGKGCSPVTKRSTRLFAFTSVVLFAFIGVETMLFPRASWNSSELSEGGPKPISDQWIGWEDFSPERLEQLKKEGTPVFIDFTAKWCLICQANHLVLNSNDVQKQLNTLGVVKMKADWTKSDPVITEALSKYGRNSVPLYVLYGTDQKEQPVILPQVLTPDVVAEHLVQAIPNDIALK